jgi:hypothetical protein
VEVTVENQKLPLVLEPLAQQTLAAAVAAVEVLVVVGLMAAMAAPAWSSSKSPIPAQQPSLAV